MYYTSSLTVFTSEMTPHPAGTSHKHQVHGQPCYLDEERCSVSRLEIVFHHERLLVSADPRLDRAVRMSCNAFACSRTL